jgi:hypothetical protein
MVWSLFNGLPLIDRVVMVRASGSPFFLVRGPHQCWFDVTGKQVMRETEATKQPGISQNEPSICSQKPPG